MASDFKLVIAKFSGSLGRGGAGTGEYSVTDIRELQKRLRAIEPSLRTELVREAKAIAKPLESDIKTAIGTVQPLSGMLKDQGRLGWGVGVPANKTLVQWRTAGGGKSLTTSLVRVKVQSPAVGLVDMAGRSGRYVGTGRKNDNSSSSLQRRNHSPAKGQALIRSLNQRVGGAASRVVWPAAEKSLPDVRAAIEAALRKAYARVSRGF